MLYKDYLLNRRQYQEEGRDLLLNKKHACLFYEPGKGKTYPCIEAVLEVERIKNRPIKVLIISSCDAIRKMWNVDIVPQKILPKNTYLVTDRTAIGDLSKALLEETWDVMVVDECHIVKAHNTKIHRLVQKLSRKIEYVFGLTGTPRGNRDIDIWCQFQAMNVANQGNMSYTAWTTAYCDFEIGYGQFGQFKTPVSIKNKYKSWWDELLREHCQFVNYDDKDDMPDLNIQVIKLPYKKTEEYNNAYKGIIDVGEFATTTTKLTAISKAHQACNGYLYLPDKSVFRIHANKTKTDYVLNLPVNERIVIVYKYKADLAELSETFAPIVYTTDVDEFKRGKKQLLFLQCGCCQSFNLQDYSHKIVFYTLDYSFIKYKQMLHRLYRLGQKIPTEIIVLQHEGTVEKQIWDAVKTKQNMHDLYMSIKRS